MPSIADDISLLPLQSYPAASIEAMMLGRTLPTPSNWMGSHYSAYSSGQTSPTEPVFDRTYAMLPSQSLSGQVMPLYYSTMAPGHMAQTNPKIPNRKGPWGPQEDRELTELVNYEIQKTALRYAPGDVKQSSEKDTIHWGEIAQRMRFTRTAKQCRERWTQNLHPDLKRTAISEEEGHVILDLVDKKGKKWAEIARDPRLKGRSDNHIKNWWNGWNNGQRSGNDRQRTRRQIRAQHVRDGPKSYVAQQSLPHMITPPISEGSSSVSPPPRFDNGPAEVYPSAYQQPISPAEYNATYPYPNLPPVTSIYTPRQSFSQGSIYAPSAAPAPMEPKLSPEQRPQPRLSISQAGSPIDDRRRSNDPFLKVMLN